MVEAELAFLEMKVERFQGYTVELGEPAFRERLKRLNAVDVVLTSGKLVQAMVHPVALLKADVDQPVITRPAVGVDHAGGVDLAADHRFQASHGAVRDDLGEHLAAA